MLFLRKIIRIFFLVCNEVIVFIVPGESHGGFGIKTAVFPVNLLFVYIETEIFDGYACARRHPFSQW